MTAALVLDGVAVPFGTRPGLAGIALEVPPGGQLALLGASGSGKSSLLRAIAGLGPLDAGRVVVAGRDVTHEPPEARGVVYLHQAPLLFPHLSVAGNVAFPLEVRRVPAAERVARVHAALDAVRLAELAGRRPHELSGGQRQRAALARALVARPAVLLLDEPFTGLDPALRQEVREALVALQATHRSALVLVTHDLDDAAFVGDRIGVLHEGGLAQVAAPAELFARPRSLAVARLTGIPNAVPASLRADGTAEGPLGTLRPGAAFAAPGAVTLVFRPEALLPDPEGPLAGIVRSVHARAAGITMRLEVAGHALEARQPDDGPPPDIGATLRCRLREDRVVAVAAEP